MVEADIFYYFLMFSFDNIKKITHNSNGYTAASSYNNTIVIWKNSEVGPNVHEGKIISIIVDQFSSIDQLLWVHGTNTLLIRNGERISVWDIFNNKEERTYLSTEPILYAKSISLGTLVVKESGKFSLYKGRTEISSQISSDIIIDVEEGVFIYPTLFSVKEGEWVEEELSMSWGERGLRRNFEGNNDIQINGDLIQIGDEEFDDLVIPEEYSHNFNNGGVTIVKAVENGFFIKNKTYGLLVQEQPTNDAVIVHDNDQVLFGFSNNTYYILRSLSEEHRIIWKKDRLVKESLLTDLIRSDIALENTPPYFYLDFSQDPKYVQFNDKHLFLWYPDLDKDYVFIDLLQELGSIFTNFGRNHHDYILVERWGKQLLQWQRGKNYPSGKLKLYNLEKPNQKPKILYDEQIISKRIDLEQFKNGEEELEFPLILPQWHKIELWSYYEEPVKSTQLSYSQYYTLIERLSKSENAALLKYSDFIPEDIAFIHFGDLILDTGEQELVFEKIAPEWTTHLETGQLAYYSIDGFGYIINTFDEYLLPFYSFKAQLPYLMQFSPDGRYLIYISFEVRKTDLMSHPQSKESEHLSAEFPYMVITIHNIFQKKSKSRSVRFPQLLEYDRIELEFSSDRVLIYFPSYTDNREESVLMYNFSNNKFHQVTGTEYNRLWMTHSKNSPVDRLQKGTEFPIQSHPEISRDYAMRPFKIYEGVLVRKSDQLAITMADINLEPIPQRSNLDLYDLEHTTKLDVPFYYNNKMKPIFLDKNKAKGLKLNEFYPLNQIESIDPIQSFIPEKVPRNKSLRLRFVEFFKNLKENRIIHSNQGIAFESENFETYQKNLDQLIEEYS